MTESNDITPPRFGWIGLGNMGLAMAINLQKNLTSISAPPLAYHNRTMSRGESLSALGATAYTSPADLVRDSDIIFISLSDDAAVLSLLTTILSTHPTLTHKLFLDTTTVSPSTTTRITTLLTTAHATFIASPVFGGHPVALAGTLLFALAGPAPSIALVKPYISSCLARHVIVVGTDPKDALVLKATGNFITASLADTLAHAHVLAEKAGLGVRVVHELIGQNYGAYAGGVSEKMVQGRYAPREGERAGSDVRLAVKDVRVGVELGREVGMGEGVRAGEILVERLERARGWGEREGRELDSSAVYGIVREEAGLGFEREDVLERRSLEDEEKRADGS